MNLANIRNRKLKLCLHPWISSPCCFFHKTNCILLAQKMWGKKEKWVVRCIIVDKATIVTWFGPTGAIFCSLPRPVGRCTMKRVRHRSRIWDPGFRIQDPWNRHFEPEWDAAQKHHHNGTSDKQGAKNKVKTRMARNRNRKRCLEIYKNS